MNNTYIERHTYAPELSKFFYKGIQVKNVNKHLINNSLKSVNEVKKEIFKKPGKFKKGIKIKVIYPEQYKSLNKIYSGTFNSYKSIKITLKFINKNILTKIENYLTGVFYLFQN